MAGIAVSQLRIAQYRVKLAVNREKDDQAEKDAIKALDDAFKAFEQQITGIITTGNLKGIHVESSSA